MFVAEYGQAGTQHECVHLACVQGATSHLRGVKAKRTAKRRMFSLCRLPFRCAPQTSCAHIRHTSHHSQLPWPPRSAPATSSSPAADSSSAAMLAERGGAAALGSQVHKLWVLAAASMGQHGIRVPHVKLPVSNHAVFPRLLHGLHNFMVLHHLTARSCVSACRRRADIFLGSSVHNGHVRRAVARQRMLRVCHLPRSAST